MLWADGKISRLLRGPPVSTEGHDDRASVLSLQTSGRRRNLDRAYLRLIDTGYEKP